MIAATQTDWHRRRNSLSHPPWDCPKPTAYSGRDPLGNYCHSGHIGRQTSDNSCALPFAFPTTDRWGLNLLFRLRITFLDEWQHQKQTRGFEIVAEHETGKRLRDNADENFRLIFGPDTTTTNPYNPSETPDVLDIVVTKELSFPVHLTSCPHQARSTSRY